jgi:hypothetical protein
VGNREYDQLLINKRYASSLDDTAESNKSDSSNKQQQYPSRQQNLHPSKQHDQRQQEDTLPAFHLDDAETAETDSSNEINSTLTSSTSPSRIGHRSGRSEEMRK